MGLIEMLFSANGRIGRRDYWLWSILVNLAALALQYYAFGRWTAAPAFLDALFYQSYWGPDDVTLVYFLLVGLTLWPVVCLNAKRWHDRGKPGWIASLVMALGIACYALTWVSPSYYEYDFEVMSRVLPLVYGGFLLWTFVEVGLLPGTPGSNRYGYPDSDDREEAYY